MEKPITLIISETKDKIVTIVNESKLPMFVLDNIFKDFYTDIHTLSIQQEQAEKIEYEKYIAQEKSDANKEE